MDKMISHGEEGTGTKNPDGTYTYTYRVNTSEHGNADGEYNTHIYAYDKNGRLTYLYWTR